MEPILIATRGSALALAQSRAVHELCCRRFPKLSFELKILKTTGDKLQTAAPAQLSQKIPRGLFTKELETALLRHKADLAVHSLKDLPTDLPDGLTLAAVAGKREDVRDALIYRLDSGLAPGMKLADLPRGWVVATGSARRKTQLLALRPDFSAADIRGNVPTRLEKLAKLTKFNATLLAVAGMNRLDMRVAPDGRLKGPSVPDGLAALILEPEQMLPCVGQGAVGLEIRAEDERLREICGLLNHVETFQCVAAERSFLRAMGGGCQTPIGAYACVVNEKIHLRAVAHLTEDAKRAEATGSLNDPEPLGIQVAELLGGPPA